MNSKPAVAIGRSSSTGSNFQRPGANGLSKILLLVLAQITHVAAAPLKNYITLLKLEDPDEAEAGGLVLYMSVALVLVLLGGAFAGLTIA
jgi:metal transporter CNNM